MNHYLLYQRQPSMGAAGTGFDSARAMLSLAFVGSLGALYLSVRNHTRLDNLHGQTGGLAGSAAKGAPIEVIRIEKKLARWTPKHTMHSMSRAMMHDPHKVVGAFITLGSTDPEVLRGPKARELVHLEARKLGLHGKMVRSGHVYQENRRGFYKVRWDVL